MVLSFCFVCGIWNSLQVVGAGGNVKGQEPCQFWSFLLSRGMLFLAARKERVDVLAGLDRCC